MAPILSLRGVSRSFGAVVVARDLDLDLAEGEALGMLGPNGAGKSTLFGLITGTLSLNSGTISFGGQDITHIPAAQRSRLGMARSFQVPQPFSGMTVFENCVAAGAFARNQAERAVYERAAYVLDQCGLTAKANVKAGTLTLLDRKRLELARALTTRPRLLLLDEVAGGLSEPECAILIELIKDIRTTGVSLIWIEHVIHALVAVVDRVVVLAGGVFIADDTPQRAIQHPKVVEVYMGIPASEAAETAAAGSEGRHVPA
ncbi:amino acid/amide ABC transporter ATP-binding protein 1, HAAT family [Faunimonas pinastri]|uniref:Amino acid/amide ABC transporter ATP-binding protein 1, HAAT family n=1 Tax=Faunimonas pinastri TaxID=1855383 RepID=A0A1H9E5P1_9HYPH|nr:ATP-binding cassette domain-containing protein [Faunimonas pinastri]SEQ20228.1 amino acid/amide ABC transporter ATP-binding protein 1, HAAT family [Faunimonas pinastri]